MPNFFVLGARRSGTGSLTHYLGQHPSICFTEPRDPQYFLRDDLYSLGMDYYVRTFCTSSNQKLWKGEATSTYFANPHIVGPRLREHYGDRPLRFIVLLPEPVARAWSHYLARLQQGDETRDFKTALRQEKKEPLGSDARYYGEGCYMQLLKEWQNYYPAENFLPLLSEDLGANPVAQARRVFTWLGVETTVPINFSERLNVARYNRSRIMADFLNHPPDWISSISKQLWPATWQRRRIRNQLRERFQAPYSALPPLDPAIANELRQSYRSEILALSKLMGRYLSHWLVEDEIVEAPRTQLAH